jgi:hypothetical protein
LAYDPAVMKKTSPSVCVRFGGDEEIITIDVLFDPAMIK